MFVQITRIVYMVMKFHLKQLAVDSFVIFTVFVQPLLVAVLAIYMLRNTNGFEAIYVIVGSGLTGLWSGTLFFCSSSIHFERRSGTLEYIVASPTHLAIVIFGKNIANTIMSIGSMFLSYPIAAFLFGFNLKITHPVEFFISFLLTIFAFISFGLLISSFMSVNLGARAWENALEFPMYILGGFIFPIALLPAWTTPASYLLSPYWVAHVLQTTSVNIAFQQTDIFASWIYIFSLSIFYCLLSAWLFKVLLRRARVEATLGYQ